MSMIQTYEDRYIETFGHIHITSQASYLVLTVTIT